MKYHVPQALVAGHEQTGRGLFFLALNAPQITQAAVPGQFLHIRCGKGDDPLLRRPISICRVDKEKGNVMLWYQVVGKGTSLLSQVRRGDCLDIVGPLGRGFEPVTAGKTVFLVGGGVGSAPLVFLGNELAPEKEVVAFFGGASEEMLLMPCLTRLENCEYATDDGSFGYPGTVIGLLEEQMKGKMPDILYACGPQGMLREVVRIAEENSIPLQVSLEARMACGVGACLGCSFPRSKKSGGGWARVCQDGPVFWDWEVAWDDGEEQ